MTNRLWFELWDQHYLKFKWFFIKYGFVEQWELLLLYRDKESLGKMKTIMNNIWFVLPSNKFNIIENPPGWNEFLLLLEE